MLLQVTRTTVVNFFPSKNRKKIEMDYAANY